MRLLRLRQYVKEIVKARKGMSLDEIDDYILKTVNKYTMKDGVKYTINEIYDGRERHYFLVDDDLNTLAYLNILWYSGILGLIDGEEPRYIEIALSEIMKQYMLSMAAKINNRDITAFEIRYVDEKRKPIITSTLRKLGITEYDINPQRQSILIYVLELKKILRKIILREKLIKPHPLQIYAAVMRK